MKVELMTQKGRHSPKVTHWYYKEGQKRYTNRQTTN